ncbi:SGNH hydrolase-type esterase domain-containing protein [Xylariaceae sp. FL1651]|nr:SGNH hydrolase-type esterase domain-containing protein [Xylariaceae sp. FL1651]
MADRFSFKMNFMLCFSCLPVILAVVAAPTAAKPPAFFLAGDSTTAVQAANGGGWGNGFLSFLISPAWGVNKGHNGATTASYVSGGDWATVEGYVTDNKADYDTYVTIQFGHNVQKSTSGISLAQYQTNLENLVTDIKNLGGTPLLVTPLTRRAFTSEHNATDSLHDQRLATIAAAEATSVTYLDLNQASLNYVDEVGDKAAQVYDLNGNDTTHLNAWGSVVFGRMLADLLIEKINDLEQWILPNETLSNEIKNGQPA